MKLPLPPFSKITAEEKVKKAENAWNTRDLVTVSEAYSEDSEWRDILGKWYRSYGNEMWQFNEDGYMTHRYASINDLAIQESERRLL